MVFGKYKIKIELPELYKVLNQLLVSICLKLKNLMEQKSPLQIAINSFFLINVEYRKIAVETVVVLCSTAVVLHNPGRYAPYKTLTGKR